ncbi:MAG TPA: zf-HC2 domain-containing protein [Pyrinomonadaceae bacterium]|nr:zf-HC2 domain-containing protein [Pyrinomonadaceae bacterium]
MREFCLTEEVIQQFVDGELSDEKTEQVASHLAGCNECAELLDRVEQESAFLAEAFAPEMSLPVPTVALRERLDAAIAAMEPRRQVATESAGARARNWFSSLFASFSLSPRTGALGFASLFVILTFAAIFAVIQLRQNKEAQTALADNKVTQPKPAQPVAPTVKDNNPDEVTPAPVPAPSEEVAKYNPATRRPASKRQAAKAESPETPGASEPKTTEPRLLPGEEGYLEAIASLTTVVEANKNEVLKPTVRVDYERNLAVVDQAIASTRQQAKRNPNDRDAMEFMYTAYQNKIDLLSAVADQTRIAAR